MDQCLHSVCYTSPNVHTHTHTHSAYEDLPSSLNAANRLYATPESNSNHNLSRQETNDGSFHLLIYFLNTFFYCTLKKKHYIR